MICTYDINHTKRGFSKQHVLLNLHVHTKLSHCVLGYPYKFEKHTRPILLSLIPEGRQDHDIQVSDSGSGLGKNL